ncbi:MAG: acyl-CoA dehydrogenase [Syntrophomonadaceae bacterium]|nr:acyl-CoA dehydrogenase [Syntrophomonadaceae bacterium]
MAERFASRRNLDFVLNEVLNVEALNQYPYFADHSAETFKMVLDTAMKMATDLMFPYFKEMDVDPPRWENGKVYVHPAIKTYVQEMAEGGWIQSEKPYEYGGQQLPVAVRQAACFLFSAANYSMSIYPMLTGGAANLIYAFGSPEQKELYLPKMYGGEWQGTMALTEPDVGSSLGDLTTSAEPTDNGYYMIKGKKIFISAASSDVVSNVVNLMLARIKGAPLGVAGISLFVVPQLRVNEQGELEDNDVVCAGIEHKLGYRGSPICQLSMGDEKNCRGWLVGKPGMGLAQMFQMMNEERIGVGIGATGKMSGAYYAALEYANQRKQGRRLDEKDPQLPMVELIEHADIKRMLLFQRSVMEGSLSLALELSRYQDLEHVAALEEKEKYALLTEFLIPILKTYPSETGILAASAAIQILGGYGYCGDFPVEQYYRDIRIDPIHEGTTGIQGQDILGRKVSMKNGKAFELFQAEVAAAIQAAQAYPELAEQTEALRDAMSLMKELTAELLAKKDTIKREAFLADSVLFLEAMGITAIAWQWLKQMTAAAKALPTAKLESDERFYRGKLFTGRYFYDYELVKLDSLVRRLRSDNRVTVEITKEYFED